MEDLNSSSVESLVRSPQWRTTSTGWSAESGGESRLCVSDRIKKRVLMHVGLEARGFEVVGVGPVMVAVLTLQLEARAGGSDRSMVEYGFSGGLSAQVRIRFWILGEVSAELKKVVESIFQILCLLLERPSLRMIIRCDIHSSVEGRSSKWYRHLGFQGSWQPCLISNKLISLHMSSMLPGVQLSVWRSIA